MATSNSLTGSNTSGYYTGAATNTSSALWTSISNGTVNAGPSTITSYRIGKTIINGDEGLITFKADNGDIVFDIKTEVKVKAIINELRDNHPEVLFDLIMKGLI